MTAAGDPSDHRAIADDAVSPGQIPARGWRQLLRRATRHVVTAHLPLFSAGIAFFAVLSIAPVLVTALLVYGAVNTPAQALDQLSQVAEMLPAQLQPIVVDQLRSITNASTKVFTVRGLAGLVIALWTATTAMASLIDALTVAYHETETRGFLRRSVLAIAFVLGGALLLGAVIAVAGVASRALGEAPEVVRTVAPVFIWLALAALMSAVLVHIRVARRCGDQHVLALDQRPAGRRWRRGERRGRASDRSRLHGRVRATYG